MPALDRITVIVPVGPADRAFVGLLPALAPFAQTILVFAEGEDRAVLDAAAAEAVVVIVAPRGRARQLNAGLAAASCPWVLLLHADSRFGDGAVEAVRALPALPPCLAYFDLAFEDGPRAMALNAAGARLRSRVFGLPFGDQGMLVPRDLLAALGGFDETVAAGEDHALVWAARRAGVPLRPLGATLLTSARRYAQRGWLATTLRHLLLTCWQALGYATGPSRRGAPLTRGRPHARGTDLHPPRARRRSQRT